MKKIKKYIFPFLFSALFWILYFVALFIINTFITDGGLAIFVFFLFVMIWCYVIVPIFSVRYIRLIREEKLKFLFAVYNPIVLTAVHVLPWIITNSLKWYFALILTVFMIWSTLWSILPLVIYLISLKKKAEAEENTAEVDALYVESNLQTSKNTRRVSLCFVLIYALNLVFSAEFFSTLLLQTPSLSFVLQLVPPALILAFLFSCNKSHFSKAWLLSLAFGTDTVYYIVSLISVIGSASLYASVYSQFVYTIMILRSALSIIAAALMFIGTLFDFKHIKLLKCGTLGVILTSLINLVIVITRLQGVPVLIRILTTLLFYIGIFILSTDKKVGGVSE